MAAHFKGTGVAIVTPFAGSGVDYDGLTRVIDHVINGGVDYVVALGSTGEAITCDAAECRKILDHCIRQIDGRVPLVAGPFGYNSTKTVVDKIKGFNFDGIDAILSSSPAYNKPSQEGIYQHFMKIAEVSSVPIILYNVPGRTSSNMHAETTLRLGESADIFVGIKEASGDLSQAMQIAKHRHSSDFLLISGEDELTMPMMAGGADGAISVISNAYPDIYSEMVNFALVGDFEMARERQFELLDVHQHLYVEGNPVGIKGLMELLGICNRDVRLPLVKLSEEVMGKLALHKTKLERVLA